MKKTQKRAKTAILCFSCAMLDFITTYIVIEKLGGVELNPTMNYVLNFGWEWLLLVKIVVPLSIPLIFLVAFTKYMTISRAWLILAAIQFLAAGFNITNILYHFCG